MSVTLVITVNGVHKETIQFTEEEWESQRHKPKMARESAKPCGAPCGAKGAHKENLELAKDFRLPSMPVDTET